MRIDPLRAADRSRTPRTGLGYRPLQVESYRSAGSIRYAAIVVKQGGPAWAAYRGRTASQHPSLLNTLRWQGYQPVNVAVVSIAGNRYDTAHASSGGRRGAALWPA